MTPLIKELIAALRYLPGVGPKSAQRMAFHLLEQDRQPGFALVKVLQQALEQVARCQYCRTLSETTQCPLCAHPERDDSLLCVVESPADVVAIEQTGSFRGRYFVLMGRLSPLDGIGPGELGMDQLIDRISQAQLREVIIATNPTVEGEATAHYIRELVKKQAITASRIAYGVPLGGELDYIDGGTLTQALVGRQVMAE